MTQEELLQRQKAYVMGWAVTAKLLEEERQEQVRRTDTMRSGDLLDDAFESEMWLRPQPRNYSGMVEMQAIFARARL